MTLATDRFDQPQIQLLPKPVNFDAFIDWYPENAECRYELRREVIVEMPKPRGKHSEVAGFNHDELAINIRKNNYPYFIPRECVIKCSNDTGYEPDVVVLDRPALVNEPRWEKSSVIENGTSIKLVIEVVSTNWQDDYEVKLVGYEALGIPEFWIVDYAGLGGVRHIGKPKQPTLTICTLVDSEYELQQFRGDDLIISPTFPHLNLTAAQVLQIN
jgi:Uma2 family endonuclease